MRSKKRSKRKSKKKRILKTLVTALIICAVSFAAICAYVFFSSKAVKIRYPVKYYEYIEKYSEEYELEPETICATIYCESKFDPGAVSRREAIGLMQITHDTLEWLCFRSGENADEQDLTDPETNIRFGTMLLAYLFDVFGDDTLAHAAYNAGIGRVRQWMDDDRYFKDGKLYHIPFAETRAYVARIAEAKERYAQILSGGKNPS